MADIPFTQIDKERLDILAGTRRGQTDQRAVRWADLGKVNAATRGVHRLVERAVRDLDDIERAITPGDPLDVPLGLSLSTALTPSGARLRADWIGTIVPNGATFYDLRIRESGGNDIIHPTASNRYEWQVQRGVTYTVAVRASDRFGNKSAWSPDATIVSATDTDPPAKVSALSATAGYGVIWLEWKSAPDDDLSHYEVLEQDAALPAPDGSTPATFSTMATAFTRSGLDDDVTRYYWVRAVDTSGNRGAWSDLASETTLSGAGVDAASLAEILNDADNAGIIPSQAIGTVAAEKLVISSLDNLILNNLLQTADGWALDPGIQIDDAPANVERKRAFLISDDATDRFAEYLLPSGSVRAGESYLISMIARGGGGAPRQFTPRIEVDWLGKDGGQIGATDGESFAPTINTSPATVARKVTAPTGAMSARIRFGRDMGSGDTGIAWIAAPRASEMGAGKLIADGSILAIHMSSDELITLSAQIKDAIITDAKIVNLRAEKIEVGALNAGITVGQTGVSIGTVQSQADDPAARVNQKATTIEPGKVKISGGTTLAHWAKGGDETKIDGGMVSANTIRANALEIGNRALQLSGILFDYNEPGQDQVSWSDGEIHYVGDDGQPATASITAGSATWTSGTLYIYWTKGNSTISASSSSSVAFADGNVVLATYGGDDELSADYGKTIIDGGIVKANTIHISESAQIDAAIINTAHIADLTSEVLTVNSLLRVADSGALGVFKESLEDPIDGAYFGREEGGRFGMQISRTEAGKRQEVSFTDAGLTLSNAKYFLTGETEPPAPTTCDTDLPKTALPAGTTRVRIVGAWGGGGGGTSSSVGTEGTGDYPGEPPADISGFRFNPGAKGGDTVIELYDGDTLKHTITAPGAPAQTRVGAKTKSDYSGESSEIGQGGPWAVGGRAAGGGGRHSSWYTNTGFGRTHYRNFAGRGGRAAQKLTVPWIDTSDWADPQIKVTIGAGGAGGAAHSAGGYSAAGKAGGPGRAIYQYAVTSDIPAGVVPIKAYAEGTITKTGLNVIFPPLGAGLWVLSGDSGDNLDIGYVDVGGVNTINVHIGGVATFVSSKTPVRTSGGYSANRTIRYAFYSLGVD